MNGFPASVSLVALAVVAAACGDGGADPHAGPDAAGARPTDAGEPDAGAADAGELDAGPPDADAPDAGSPPSPLVIDRVFLDGVPDGQIRQGGASTVVIEGRGLSQIRAVSIDGAAASATGGTDTARTWRLEVPHGQPVGNTPLRVSTGTGVEDLSAITVTPIVYSADAPADGRGTYASPVGICRGDDSWILARATDTMLLLAGRHECTHRVFVRHGVVLRGEGRGRTVIAGTDAGVTALGGAGTTELRELTIAGSAGVAVLLRGGDTVIDDVAVERGSTGVHLEAGGTVEVSRFGYRVADGTGLRVDHGGAVLALSASTIAAREGIVATAGQVTMRDTSIDVTGDGIVVGAAGADGDGATVAISGGRIAANRAIDAYQGSVVVDGSTLTGADGEADAGARYDSAALTLRNTTIAGFDAGIELYLGTGALGGATILLEDATVDARSVGIVAPALRAGALTVRRSRVQGLTALSVLGVPRLLDLGTREAPGDNALIGSVYAIDDLRVVRGAPISAIGSTLNGKSGDGGLIVGPVDARPLYRLRVATELMF